MRALTVELEDELYEAMSHLAQQAGTTPEALGSQCIARAMELVEQDPLLALAGTLECNVTDVGERHDYYIGQALYAEMQKSGD